MTYDQDCEDDLGSNFSRFTPPSYRQVTISLDVGKQVTQPPQKTTQEPAERAANTTCEDARELEMPQEMPNTRELVVRQPMDSEDVYWTRSKIEDWAETVGIEPPDSDDFCKC